MKFFSIFVLYCFVRVAYPYYTGSTVPSHPNLQETVGGQPPPGQLDYTMGPGLPIPYQVAQYSPETQEVNPDVTAIKHIALNPKVKAMYKASMPTKLYTIVHPNGTIEHTDEIHGVKQRYTNYLMVKAADILQHLDQPNLYETPPGLFPNIGHDQPTKPIATTNQNIEWAPNINDGPQSNQINDNRGSPGISNSKTQKLVVGSIDITRKPSYAKNSEFARTKDIQIVPLDIQLTENISKKRNKANFGVENLRDNIQAVNPLPIQTIVASNSNSENPKNDVENAKNETSSINSTTTSQIPAESDRHDTFPVVLPEVSPSGIPPVAQTSKKVNQGFVNNETLSTNSTSTPQILPESDRHDTFPVILPEVLPYSTSPVIQVTSIVDKLNQSGVTTIVEPIKSRNDNVTAIFNTTSPTSNLATVLTPNSILNVSPSNDAVNTNIQLMDTTKTFPNTTNSVNDNISDKIDRNCTIPSVSNQSSTVDNQASLTWLQLSEDRIWEAIQNNASNVYFFFLPRKPRNKEVKKTIFPNGTIIEEITETVVDDDLDVKPRVTTTTRTIKT